MCVLGIYSIHTVYVAYIHTMYVAWQSFILDICLIYTYVVVVVVVVFITSQSEVIGVHMGAPASHIHICV